MSAVKTVNVDDLLEKRLAELEARRKTLLAAMAKSQDAKQSRLFKVLRETSGQPEDDGDSSVLENDAENEEPPRQPCLYADENRSASMSLKTFYNQRRTSLDPNLLRERNKEKTAIGPIQSCSNGNGGEDSALTEIENANTIPVWDPIIASSHPEWSQPVEEPTKPVSSENQKIPADKTLDTATDETVDSFESMPRRRSFDLRMSSLEDLVTHASKEVAPRKERIIPELFAASVDDDFPPTRFLGQRTFTPYTTNHDDACLRETPSDEQDAESWEQIQSTTEQSEEVIDSGSPPNHEETTVDETENDHNAALEERLNMMLLENPLWQRALQDGEIAKKDSFTTSAVDDSAMITETASSNAFSEISDQQIADQQITDQRRFGNSKTEHSFEPMQVDETMEREREVDARSNGLDAYWHDIQNIPMKTDITMSEFSTNLSPMGRFIAEEAEIGAPMKTDITKSEFSTDHTPMRRVVAEEPEINAIVREDSLKSTTNEVETDPRKEEEENFIVPENTQILRPAYSGQELSDPVHLQSHQWSNIRNNADLETPRITNATNQGLLNKNVNEIPTQFDFGVASDLSDNSADSHGASSSSVCSKEEHNINGEDENDEDDISEASSAKPPVPEEVLTITTDFTVQSITFTETLQTHIESLGDESLVRMTKKKPSERLRSKAEKLAADMQTTICSPFNNETTTAYYANGLKKILLNPSILCQCTGPIALTKITSPSHGVFGKSESETNAS